MSLSDRLSDLAARRRALVQRAQRERAAFGAGLQPLCGAAALADRGLGVVRFLRERPLVLAGLVGVLLAVSRRHLVPIAGGALSLWRVYRAFKARPGD